MLFLRMNHNSRDYAYRSQRKSTKQKCKVDSINDTINDTVVEAGSTVTDSGSGYRMSRNTERTF